ncbi:hypothetical protein RUND412_009435 [Rhizina undulata]
MDHTILYDGQLIDSRSGSVFAVTTAFAALATIIVMLRLMSRAFVLKKVTADDYFIIVAWVLAFGLSTAISIGTKYGLGRHKDDIPRAWEGPKQKARFAYTFLYNPALMATKTSILVFYLSLFEGYRLLRLGTLVTLVVINTAGFILTMLVLFQCNPISAAFKAALPPTVQCLNTISLLYASAPINVITDLAILFMPMPVLTSLRLPKKQKIILIFVFGLGGFVSIVGIVRIYYFQKAATSNQFDWDGSISFMWASIEVDAGIICASIPMLKPLIAAVMPSFLGHNSRGTRSRGTDLILSQQLTSPPSTPYVHERTEFISYHRPTSLIKMTVKESLKPLLMVTVLFFLWGFSYGLLDVLNNELEKLFQISNTQSLGLHACYFAAYFFAPLTLSGWSLKKYGFKATFMTGLCVYGCGCLIFWSSAVLASYPGFCISMFTVGYGLATLEAGANTFISLCGPLKFSEVRLNIAQGIQAVGGVLAPLLATEVLFKRVNSTSSLVDVQWVYLGISFFVFMLALAFYYADIPELSDKEFTSPEEEYEISGAAASPLPWTPPEQKSFWESGFATGVIAGIIAQFMYCGAQEVISIFARDYLQEFAGRSVSSTETLIRVGLGLFSAGRFIAGILMLLIKPRYVLLVFSSGAVAFAAMALKIDGNGGAAAIVGIYFFESCLFPTIFSITIRGLGRWTRDASNGLVCAISGGAVFPLIYSAVMTKHGPAYAMCVPLAGYAAVLCFPLYLNFSKKERKRLAEVPKDEDVELREGCIRRKGSRGSRSGGGSGSGSGSER